MSTASFPTALIAISISIQDRSRLTFNTSLNANTHSLTSIRNHIQWLHVVFLETQLVVVRTCPSVRHFTNVFFLPFPLKLFFLNFLHNQFCFARGYFLSYKQVLLKTFEHFVLNFSLFFLDEFVTKVISYFIFPRIAIVLAACFHRSAKRRDVTWMVKCASRSSWLLKNLGFISMGNANGLGCDFYKGLTQ